MIEKYRIEVLRYYELMKEAGSLPSNLMRPTCANLRNECIYLISEVKSLADQRLLEQFIDRPYDQTTYRTAIKKCDVDKFKPLHNLIKGSVKGTNERNIELLAWMLDFSPRPYSKFFSIVRSDKKSNYYLDSELPGALKKTDHSDTNNLSTIFLETSLAINANGTMISDRKSFIPQKGKMTSNASDLSEPINFWDKRNRKSGRTFTTPIDEEIVHKQIILEYPSGVKLSVDVEDLNLIAQLVKL